MAREFRTQLYFYDDLSFEFIKRPVEASCLVEKKGEQIIRAWKDFYGTLFTFPGYKNMKPAHVSLGYSRDIILDPFNRVPTGESTTQKPASNAASVKAWIAKVAENQRHLIRGKRKSNTIAEYAQMAMIGLIILEGLAIGARYAFGHSGTPSIPEAGLLTLTFLGLIRKTPEQIQKAKDRMAKARAARKAKQPVPAVGTAQNTPRQAATAVVGSKPIVVVKSPTNWRRLWYFIGSGIAAAVTSGIGYFYFKDTSNTFVGLGFFLSLAAFIFLLVKGFHGERYTPVVVSKKQYKTENKKPANCLNIYPTEILFENVEEPLGQPHLCRNDKKHYYVHKITPIKAEVVNAGSV